jgi:hypothetical protein
MKELKIIMSTTYIKVNLQGKVRNKLSPLDEFTLATISRHTVSPTIKGISSSTHSTTITNIMKDFYPSLLEFILDDYKNKSKNTTSKEIKNLQEILFFYSPNNKKIELSKKRFKAYVIIKAQRLYSFDQETIDFVHKRIKTNFIENTVKIVSPNIVEVYYNLWIFTIALSLENENNKELNIIYNHKNQNLVFEPLLVTLKGAEPGKNFRELNTSLNTSQKTSSFFKFNKNKYKKVLCSCLSSDKKYINCCYTLFCDPNFINQLRVFGFNYLKLDQNDSKLSPEREKIVTNDVTDKIIKKINNNELSFDEVVEAVLTGMAIYDIGISKQEREYIQNPNKYKNGIGLIADDVDKDLKDLSTRTFTQYSYLPNLVFIVTDNRDTIIKSATNEKELYFILKEHESSKFLKKFLLEVNSIFEAALLPNFISLTGMYNVISSWQDTFGENNTRVIKTAIRLYYQKEYLAAVYLLIPALESTLRYMVLTLGAYTTTPMLATKESKYEDNNDREYVLLSSLIDMIIGYEDLEYKDEEILSSARGTRFLFRRILTENGSYLNIRNEASHGFNDSEPIGEYEFRIVFYLFTIMSRRFGIEKKSS